MSQVYTVHVPLGEIWVGYGQFLNSDTILLLQTDAHNYEIIGILKQNTDYRSDTFRFMQEPSSGSCLMLS